MAINVTGIASIRAQITALELPCAFRDLTRKQGLVFLELLEIDEQFLFLLTKCMRDRFIFS